LTVIKDAGRNNYGKIIWECLCDCGNITFTYTHRLKAGLTKSCGCLHKEQLINRNLKHGHSKAKNHTKEFSTWQNMKTRCLSPKSNHYKSYGGRGITICDRWLNNFNLFLADMGFAPTPNHSIERLNNDGNYEPSNCIWATEYEQQRNKNNNVKITYKGKEMIVSDFAKMIGVTHSMVAYFLKKGKNADYISNHYRNTKHKSKCQQEKILLPQ